MNKYSIYVIGISFAVSFYYGIRAYFNISDFAKQYPLTVWELGPFLGKKYYTEKGLRFKNRSWFIIVIGLVVAFTIELFYHLPK